MEIKYHVTKIINNENNITLFFPTEILDSMNEVLEYSHDFFNNKKIYQTKEEGSNESYIKCVNEDFKIIHLIEKWLLLKIKKG